jgi:regulator of protease activity HflC (stomatin/prohibitin superfamily)
VPVPKKIISEKAAPTVSGLIALLVVLIIAAVDVWWMIQVVVDAPNPDAPPPLFWAAFAIFVVDMLLASGLAIVAPGDTKVVQFFGSYIGTIRKTGLRMTYPLTSRAKVSVKVRNFETREIKVNDARGNPIMIAAIVVWQVADTAEAKFAVEKYEEFVHVQSEAALRHVATIHPYDNGDEGEATLRGSTDIVAAELEREVSERIKVAGVSIVETRISSLSYSPEIASAMLQRQQAEAILAARAKIVEGAVTMVESALARLEDDEIVHLDEERKAAMVSNLLVVLCSDSRATPTINTGSLYT